MSLQQDSTGGQTEALVRTRSVYPLETCDGVSTRRFWAWQGNLRVPNWCQIHRQQRRSAQPSQRLPQRHSGTAARVLWCSRPCPSPSWPSVGPRAALTVIGHRRRQAAQRLGLGQKQMGLMRRALHQVGELSSRRLCSRYEGRSAGGVVFCSMRALFRAGEVRSRYSEAALTWKLKRSDESAPSCCSLLPFCLPVKRWLIGRYRHFVRQATFMSDSPCHSHAPIQANLAHRVETGSPWPGPAKPSSSVLLLLAVSFLPAIPPTFLPIDSLLSRGIKPEAYAYDAHNSSRPAKARQLWYYYCLSVSCVLLPSQLAMRQRSASEWAWSLDFASTALRPLPGRL
ncbi:hypothetical protein TgHK011_006550 [Trichoderma gracile]|nr:hypothetical protein TgHK011_006550 [Trichoderma gracile]